MKRTPLAVVIAVAIFMPWLGQAQEAAFQVIAHPDVSVQSVSAKDLSRIFLKKRFKWPDGSAAAPIDQSLGNAVTAAFTEQVHGKSVTELDSYWQGQVFSGRQSPPPVADSDKAALDLVRQTQGAVAYVSRGANLTGVKLITVTN